MSTRGPVPAGVAEPLRVVCAYEDGALSSAWFQAVQRARRTMRRAGYRARIDLVPASELPLDADVVIAPARMAASLTIGGAEVVVAEPATLGPALDALVDRFVAAGRLGRGPESPRAIAIHRGFQAIGDRARLPE